MKIRVLAGAAAAAVSLSACPFGDYGGMPVDDYFVENTCDFAIRLSGNTWDVRPVTPDVAKQPIAVPGESVLLMRLLTEDDTRVFVWVTIDGTTDLGPVFEADLARSRTDGPDESGAYSYYLTLTEAQCESVASN